VKSENEDAQRARYHLFMPIMLATFNAEIGRITHSTRPALGNSSQDLISKISEQNGATVEMWFKK
jgi:hypothetical protein